LPVLRRELESLGDNANSLLRATRRQLSWAPEMLDESARRHLHELAQRHPRFKTVLEFRSELKQLWEGAHTSNERLLADFKCGARAPSRAVSKGSRSSSLICGRSARCESLRSRKAKALVENKKPAERRVFFTVALAGYLIFVSL